MYMHDKSAVKLPTAHYYSLLPIIILYHLKVCRLSCLNRSNLR